MALLTFLISLLFALLALRGWPVESGVWTQALLAMGFLAIGTAAMVFSASSPVSKRLIGVRKRRWLDRMVNGLCITLIAGLLYGILVFAPPASSELRLHVVTVIQERFGWGAEDQEPVDADEADLDQGYEMEVGGLFDPNGAIVPKSADLSPSPEPAVSLKMADRASCEKLRRAGPVYLHLFSHHLFDGDRWTSPNLSAFTKIEAGPDGLIHLEPLWDKPEYQYTILRHEFSNGLDALCTLQGLRHVRLPELAELNEGTWLLPPPDNPFGIIRPYQAASSPKSFRNLLARGALIEAEFAGEDYLAPSKNEKLNLLIRDLADAFRRNASLQEQLADLQARMSNSFVYSMSLDYPDKNKSPLESFLEDPGTSEGFCVHFASATALILRELGVPSRVSYGWAGGQFYPEHHQFVFRSSDGHAWTEIHLKDHGWVVFETTPSSGLPNTATAPAGEIPPASGSAIEGLNLSERDPAPVGQTGYLERIWTSPVWRWALILMGGAAAGMVLITLIRNNRFDGITHADSALQSEPPGYLQLFYKTCASLGHPKATGDTLRQYLEHLEERGVGVPFADELLAYHYDLTYRGKTKDKAMERRLSKRIRAI